jgi:hypothetical protein
MYSWRAKLGIALISLMALLALGTLAGYRSAVQRNGGQVDVAILNAPRFDGLRSILPHRGTVGYLSDADEKADYFLTQYFLAPVVVAHDAQQDLVVANVRSPAAIAKLAAAHNLTVVRNFQNGIALLRRN